MAKKNVTVNPFKNECKVINLETEYPGYEGEIKYAIITDFTEEELHSHYEKEITRYIPFVILSKDAGRIIREYERNEEKFAKREARYESVFIALTEEEEATISSLSVADEHSIRDAESDAEEAKQRRIVSCRAALKRLTPVQRDYLVRHYLYGDTFREIADDVGKNPDTVCEICHVARKLFMKYARKKGVAA